ncbi:VRR-NUC domain-containing protein [Spirosoma terrae]|uniref:VRR-NUC domain-containing protein n=1 Tax=Spirosoma terrae TaxID=1968276 RepID=A0A6L9L3Z7_9BACT|nr:VRR-NUC domain-containing protein [Spirosoma terrae]NDU95246.1 VRR-NUC domain-containing protein [Spirosoma terrae]
MADQQKAIKYANVPRFALVKSRYTDKSANDLTTAVVDYLNLSGFFATRLASTGTFRADLQKYVPSRQRSGLPDVMAVVDGRSVFIEVKVGKDRLSEEQREAINDLENAGASVFVAGDFQGFYDWFQKEFQTAPFA